MSSRIRAFLGAALSVTGLALLVSLLLVTNSAPSVAADKGSITKFLTAAIESNYRQEILPPGLAVGHMNASAHSQLRGTLSAAHRQYFGGAALTKVLGRDLNWADRAASGPTPHTLKADVSNVTIASMIVDGHITSVAGTFDIYHKDASPMDAAGHELVTAAWNTMSFTAELDDSSGRWLIVQWQADVLTSKEDTSARSGDQYLPSDQAKPTLPQMVPAPLNP